MKYPFFFLEIIKDCPFLKLGIMLDEGEVKS